jgi:hypothetical protein
MMVNLETACLLSILMGQWLQFWLTWRMYLSIVELVASLKITKMVKPMPREMDLIPPRAGADEVPGEGNPQRRP